MIKVTNEEGHYTIKIVKELPKRGNFNWLYAIKDTKIDKVYKALPEGKYETIILGESTDLFKDTALEFRPSTNELVVTFADGSEKTIRITSKTSELENDGDGSSNFATLEDLNQTSAGSIEAPSFVVALSNGKTLGKYVNGNTVPAFTTIQEQIKDIAQETINPTFVSPTFSVSLSNTATQEVGSSYSATLTGNFNRGQILGDLDGGIWNASLEQDRRAGVSTSYDLDGTSQAGNSLVVSRTIVLGNNVFSGVVNYGVGPQPLNSVGGNFDSPLVAGSLSATRTVPGAFKSFFGISANTSLTSAQIIALSSGILSTSKTRNYTNITSGSGNYIYYSYRASYGDLTNVILDGATPVLGAFSKLANVSVTNSFGIIEDYIVYRSNATNAFTNNSLNFS